ncbi:MAG: carboxypeptidase-like regulatory domain-containing protein [Bacteroidia bacterium]
MKRNLLLSLLLFCAVSISLGQNVTLSGYVYDELNGESLIGATIFIPEAKAGTYSNSYGFYSLSVPPGKYAVQYRFIGFGVKTDTIELSESMKLDVRLSQMETTTEEVVISAESASTRLQSTEMGVERLSIKEIKKLPVLFGETDILKTIQLLPGVKAAGEGSSGFFVRGGGIDQNLILLDEAPVYNPAHLLGFFSVFNGDAIKSTKLYKGNMPAEYGGRLSSVLDVQMKDGNKKDYELSGGIGLISSRLTFEGPIVEDKGSFMISARRTYADAFLALSADTNLQNTQLYFYDLNMKANYRLGEKDQVFISGYFGRDKFGIADQFGLNWGNATGTVRWNHLFSDKLFLNSTLIYSDYDYEIDIAAAGATINSGIKDWNWKEDFSYYANQRHTFKFGTNAIYHTFVPGVVSNTGEGAFNATEIQDRYALESAAYFSHEWKATEKFNISYGLRASNFTVLGPGTVYSYDAEGTAIDSVKYDQGDIIKNYFGLEPRVSASYLISPKQSIKASYARNRQYIHLLTNSTGGSPTDLWLPSSATIAPEIADQLALGYFQTFGDKYEGSVEVYYKDLQNQIDYKNGANIFLNETVESELVFGDGWSYGAEFLLRKTAGKFTGWAAYTWSRTFRQFDEINNGEAFSARQDRIHDISLVAMYDPNPKWSFSATWVYNTGDAVTYPNGSYVYNGQIVPLYGERNADRLPDYHRLDLSATWFGKNPRSSWNVSVYNAYNRKNVFSLDFRESESNPGTTEAVKTYLFGAVPSLTYNFSF